MRANSEWTDSESSLFNWINWTCDSLTSVCPIRCCSWRSDGAGVRGQHWCSRIFSWRLCSHTTVYRHASFLFLCQSKRLVFTPFIDCVSVFLYENITSFCSVLVFPLLHVKPQTRGGSIDLVSRSMVYYIVHQWLHVSSFRFIFIIFCRIETKDSSASVFVFVSPLL